MKKKRSRRRPARPPPVSGASRPRARRPGQQTLAQALPTEPSGRELQYKVVELSTVDEGALERTLNEWTPRGWNLETVQFAMRESSKRPAMAFVFFTREVDLAAAGRVPGHHEAGAAREKLRRLAALPPVETALSAGAAPEQEPAAGADHSVRAAVELAAAALFDAGAGEDRDKDAEGENGAVRWVELPEENEE